MVLVLRGVTLTSFAMYDVGSRGHVDTCIKLRQPTSSSPVLWPGVLTYIRTTVIALSDSLSVPRPLFFFFSF